MVVVIIIAVALIVLIKLINRFNRYEEELQQQKKQSEEKLQLQKKQDDERFASLQNLYEKELQQLHTRLQNSTSLRIQSSEYADIISFFSLRELAIIDNNGKASQSNAKKDASFIRDHQENVISLRRRIQEAIDDQYKFRYLLYLYPELSDVFHDMEVVSSTHSLPAPVDSRVNNIASIINLLKRNADVSAQLIYWKNRVDFLESAGSNLTAIPYMASIMADYETYGLEHLAKELDWGYDTRRLNKVKSIREIRKDAEAMVEKNKESQYQLAYLLNLFPNLQDIIDTEFNQLPVIQVSELSNYDSVRDYLSKEEYAALSETERNQLALDRYRNSHKKTKWQIGRDYEQYVGYTYSQKGYTVDYFGSYMGLEDLGRDLIAKKGNETVIVQCKYWSSKKQIHENHVNQLYGTMVSYCIERNVSRANVKGVLVTNIELSPMAKKMASYLGIEYIENLESGDYPCIKCNIGRGEYGETTKIYHLPFDQQYDATKICDPGEFFAMTVAEAEAAGFRRAFKWFGSS